MVLGDLPSDCATLRMAARSASSGTPVKSCSTTRVTTKGTSSVRSALGAQLASCSTCSAVTFWPSQLRSTDSSTMRIETGSLATLGYCFASSLSDQYLPALPDAVLKVLSVGAKACAGALAMWKLLCFRGSSSKIAGFDDLGCSRPRPAAPGR